MVMVRLLSDSGEMNTTFGQIMLGTTVVEDLAVICMTVLIPIAGGDESHR